MALDTAFQRPKQADDARPALPREHRRAPGAGLAPFLFARRSRSSRVRSILGTAPSGLVARAASGGSVLRGVFR